MKRCKLFYLIGLLFSCCGAELCYRRGSRYGSGMALLGATFLLLGCSQQKK